MKLSAQQRAEFTDLCDALTERPSLTVRRAIVRELLAMIESAEDSSGKTMRSLTELQAVSDTNGSTPEAVEAALFAPERQGGPNGFDTDV